MDLFGDLCLNCLDAIWDVVMDRVSERRKHGGGNGVPSTPAST